MIQPDYSDALTGPFWRAANEQQLVMSWCDDCNQAVWYPKPECPVCKGSLFWKPLNGRAKLYAWSVVMKPVNPVFQPPYIPALVVPEEAPNVRLVTQMVDCEPDQLACDMPVSVSFQTLTPRDGEGFLAPVFKPRA